MCVSLLRDNFLTYESPACTANVYLIRACPLGPGGWLMMWFSLLPPSLPMIIGQREQQSYHTRVQAYSRENEV